MLKKVIAGIASVALALGMVALTATPASAHTPSDSATCTTVNLKFQSYSNSDTNHLEVWLDGDKVADVADFNSGYAPSYSFTKVLATHTYRYKVDVNPGTAYDVDSGTKTVAGNCLPDDTDKKVDLCHWEPAQGGKYTSNNVSVKSVINLPNGHKYHANDIIPPFTYTEQGDEKTFPGLNWTTAGQNFFNAGCKGVTPTAPTKSDAVCVTTGDSTGSYTIPAKTGVQYQQKFSAGGTYTDVAAGTWPIEKGQTVYIQAIALPDYQLAGNAADYKWTFTIGGTDASKCVQAVVPTFNPSTCVAGQPGGKTTATLVIPNVTGIQYQYKSGSSWTNIDPGSYDNPTGTVQIRAVVKSGYTIVPGSDVGTWSFTYSSPGDCKVTVTAPPPTSTDGVCVAAGQSSPGSITAPAGPWVGFDFEYRVKTGSVWSSWTDLDPGESVSVAIGSQAEIRAVALSGYTLTGTKFWSGTIGGPAFPYKCLQAPAPTKNPAVCIEGTPGGYTNGSFVVPAAVTGLKWQVWDGDSWENINSGPYNVPSLPAQVKLRAVAISPYQLVPGTTSEWTFDYSVPEGGCLVTVNPVNPKIDDTTCSAPGVPSTPKYTIPVTTGVTYWVKIGDADWAEATAGPHDATPGVTYQFKAVAAPGYTPGVTVLESTTFANPSCVESVTPNATANDWICTQDRESVLSKSYVRVFWATGIVSYDIEGYGVVTNPNDPLQPSTVVFTGNPLEELTITPTLLSGYASTVPLPLTVTFGPKLVDQCAGLIGDPVPTDQVCVDGAASQGSVYVERKEGLRYTITGGSLVDPIVIDGLGEDGDLYLDGNVPLPPGTYNVDTSALPGYVLDPDPANLPYPFTIHAPVDGCVITVTLTCQLTDGLLTIPATPHVVWTVDVPSDGNPPLYENVPGGFTIPVTIDSKLVTASIADVGYVFSDPLAVSWFVQLTEGSVECGDLTTLPPIPTNVEVTPAKCANGTVTGATITVGQVDDENWFPEVEYFLDGSATPLSAITTPIGAGHHEVTAVVVDNDDTIADGYPSFWEFDVAAAPETCELDTLALTGPVNPFGWAGIGYYLLVTGLALIAVRTLRRREVKQK